MGERAQALIAQYQMTRLPVEGTWFASTYRATQQTAEGNPASTAILGLYSNELDSVSCFHRLDYDEVWHFYDGDPLILYLLHPDGRTEEIVMGRDFAAGERVQAVVPAHTWQGGCTVAGGDYSLYGCTVAPGFVNGCFEAAVAATLQGQYPDYAEVIARLSVNGEETRMVDKPVEVLEF